MKEEFTLFGAGKSGFFHRAALTGYTFIDQGDGAGIAFFGPQNSVLTFYFSIDDNGRLTMQRSFDDYQDVVLLDEQVTVILPDPEIDAASPSVSSPVAPNPEKSP
jgi:hypothetical protein